MVKDQLHQEIANLTVHTSLSIEDWVSSCGDHYSTVSIHFITVSSILKFCFSIFFSVAVANSLKFVNKQLLFAVSGRWAPNQSFVDYILFRAGRLALGRSVWLHFGRVSSQSGQSVGCRCCIRERRRDWLFGCQGLHSHPVFQPHASGMWYLPCGFC